MIHRRWVATAFVFLVAFSMAAPLSAEVIAEFVDGGSNAVPVNDEVDAYFGMAGLGWNGSWQEGKASGVTYAVATAAANPLHTDDDGDVKYLDLTASATVTTRRFAAVARDYTAGIDVTKPHSIDFKYRVNETLAGSTTFTNFDDRYQMYDRTPVGDTFNADSSWGISVYGGTHAELPAEKVGKWIVYNGGGHDATPDTGFWNARNINTGITVTAGVIYDFHIDIDPDTYTWDVTIGTGGTTLYDSTVAFQNGLGWRTSNATVAGVPHFNATCKTGADARAYSLDAVRVSQVPEPSALLLLVSAGMALAACSRRGRS